jgi:pSer/pThr/pTyr-binding forkhead associated (FHA) protein
MAGSSKTRSHTLNAGTLVVTAGPHTGEVFDVGMEYTLIGRAPGLAVSLPGDDLVSRQHARITGNVTG